MARAREHDWGPGSHALVKLGLEVLLSRALMGRDFLIADSGGSERQKAVLLELKFSFRRH